MNTIGMVLGLVIVLCMTALIVTGTVWCVAKIIKSLR